MFVLTPEQVFSQGMVEAAFPPLTTPPRRERLEAFDMSCSAMAGLAVDAIFDLDKSRPMEHELIVPMGIYATRSALQSLVQKDTVDFATAVEVADELQDLCTFLKNKNQTAGCEGTNLGFFAELGMANMIWSGIAEGELDLKYCVMTGTHGYEKDHSGLRGDVDLIVRTGGNGKSARKQIQVKASRKRQSEIYDDGITVVTSQDVVDTRTPQDAVSKLVNWKNQTEVLKTATYARFSSRLGLKTPKRK